MLKVADVVIVKYENFEITFRPIIYTSIIIILFTDNETNVKLFIKIYYYDTIISNRPTISIAINNITGYKIKISDATCIHKQWQTLNESRWDNAELSLSDEVTIIFYLLVIYYHYSLPIPDHKILAYMARYRPNNYKTIIRWKIAEINIYKWYTSTHQLNELFSQHIANVK